MNNIIDHIKYYDYKKLIFPITIIILYIILFVYFEEKINNIEIPVQEETIIKEEPQIEQEEPVKYIYVDIKGAIKKPGVYKLEENSRIIDQTTTNMIQRISHLFAINPLISKEI